MLLCTDGVEYQRNQTLRDEMKLLNMVQIVATHQKWDNYFAKILQATRRAKRVKHLQKITDY